jgi:hypothetical protein
VEIAYGLPSTVAVPATGPWTVCRNWMRRAGSSPLAASVPASKSVIGRHWPRYMYELLASVGALPSGLQSSSRKLSRLSEYAEVALQVKSLPRPTST